MLGSPSLDSLSKHCWSTSYSLSKPKTSKFLQVRSQSFKDEGNSSNMVDANLDVLRARMQEVMKHEKLDYTTSKTIKNSGWKYSSMTAGYDIQNKNGYAAVMTETIELLGLVGGSLGFVFLFGSLLIFLVSLLVHLCK